MERAEAEAILDGERETAVALLMRIGELVEANQRPLRPMAHALELGPGVFEAECAVEDEPAVRRVGIRAEVAEALELHGLPNRQLRERRLDQAPLEHRLRVGVDVSEEVAVSSRVGAGEETVIETD